MPETPLTNVKAATAAEICGHFALKPEARPLLREGQTPRQFLEALQEHRRYAVAIEFLAHALPHREVIWWGCLCLEQSIGPRLSPPDAEAFKASAQWVLDPSEESRRAAQARGEAVGLSAPAGLLATATGWTGGSLAPPMANTNPKVPQPPPVPPGPYLPAKGVAGAILLMAAKSNPEKLVPTQKSFVELGVGVAEGRFVWPEVAKQPKRVQSTWTIHR